MGEPSRAEGDASVASRALDIATVEAPIALCTAAGVLQAATAPALALLRRIAAVNELPSPIPADLWRLLERTATGEAVEWRPLGLANEVLGCTRYPAAPGGYVLLMREVSSKRLALSERLHRQRIDLTERLVASIARDLRSSVASVVYSADFLNGRGDGIEPAVLAETVRDISKASANLQQTLDALLDFAHLGPSVSVPVQLREVLNRALGSLRNHYRDGAHRLRVDVAPRAELVRGNPLVIEQIFVNLLLNAVEASAAPRCVIVTAFPALRPLDRRAGMPFSICIRVWDDGPGIPPDHRPFVFDPFFTTKQGNPGLGLVIARQAAESLDGHLELTDDETGTCFSLYLPGYEGEP
ncbi:MAG TPA: HAMP domain-containing sensor histidine kinase [Polyangiaceae bacterium]|nr:HAMP domain-containing sensor histidine kinase [Polyangiaceae bacterium]